MVKCLREIVPALMEPQIHLSHTAMQIILEIFSFSLSAFHYYSLVFKSLKRVLQTGSAASLRPPQRRVDSFLWPLSTFLSSTYAV